MWFDAQGYLIGEQSKQNAKLTSHYDTIFKNGILMDTTPLLILFLGKYDEENNTKLLQNFDINETGVTRKLNLSDFQLLRQFINRLNRFHFYMTPQIFTETIKHIWENTSNEQFNTIVNYFCCDYSFLKEYFTPYEKICKHDLFHRKKLEIGDISLMINNDKKSKTVISSDMQLISIFESNGFLVIPLQFLTTLRNTIPNVN